MKMPKISVIIPCYNVQEFLPECLNSVLAQTFTDFEIICIEDCSTDNTKKILTEYAKKHKNIRAHYNEQNQKQAICRNIGMNISKGQYIYFLDSDDTISNDCLEKLYNTLIRDECDIVMAGIKPYPDTPDDKNCIRRSNQLSKWIKFQPFTKLQITEQNGYKNYGTLNVCPVNKLYRKAFLVDNDIRFINEKYVHEDDGFWLKIMACKPIITGISDETYFYRVRNSSTTGEMATNPKAHRLNYKKVLEDAAIFTKNKQNKTLYKWICYEIYKCTKHHLFYFVWNRFERRIKILHFPIFGLRLISDQTIFKLKILGIPICKWRAK